MHDVVNDLHVLLVFRLIFTLNGLGSYSIAGGQGTLIRVIVSLVGFHVYVLQFLAAVLGVVQTLIGCQIMLFLRSLSDNASVVVRRHGVIQIVLLSIGINLTLVVGAETSSAYV